MSKHSHDQNELPDVSDIANPDVSHEESDVNVATLAKFIVVLAVSTAVILVAMKLMIGFFHDREVAQELPPVSRVNPPGTRRLPPEPRLQGAPGSELLPLDDMKKFKAEQEAAINSYGWVDKQTGVVRIPIDEAKKLLVERAQRANGSAPAASPAASPAATPAAPAAKPAAAH
jgi:hypothetical protein